MRLYWLQEKMGEEELDIITTEISFEDSALEGRREMGRGG